MHLIDVSKKKHESYLIIRMREMKEQKIINDEGLVRGIAVTKRKIVRYRRINAEVAKDTEVKRNRKKQHAENKRFSFTRCNLS